MKNNGQISKKYLQAVKERVLRLDSSQDIILKALDALFEDFIFNSHLSLYNSLFLKRKLIGLYIYGKSGGGKSILTDIFLREISTSLPEIKIKRIHFHQFMIEVHSLIKKKREENSNDAILDPSKYIGNYSKY